MNTKAAAPSYATELLRIAVLTGVYFLAAKLGLALAFVHSNVTTVWPPSGIALAAALLYGPRILPGILLGAALANLFAATPLVISAVIAVGNTLEAVLGVWLLRRVRGFDPALQRVNSVLALLMFAALLSPVIAASIGTGALILGGLAPALQFKTIWITWWSGDAMGIIVIAPLLLAWRAVDWAGYPLRRRIELGLVLAMLALLGVLVVPGDIVSGVSHPLAYLVFPPLLWVALRYGVWETAVAIVTLAGMTIWQATHISTVLSGGAPLDSVIFLHGFLIMLAITALPLAARSSEGARSARDLRDSQERMRLALQAASAGAWDWDVVNNSVRWSRENFQLMGLDPERDAPSYENWLSRVHPDDRVGAETRIADTMGAQSDLNIEFRVCKPDGEVRWLNDIGRMVCDEKGAPVGMYGIQMDITARKHIEAALHSEKERAQVTLASIADGVITTDLTGRVVQLNHMAGQLTGWTAAEACGAAIDEVFRLVSEDTHTAQHTPSCEEIVAGMTAGLNSNMQLLSRDGQLYAIEFSAAPIRDNAGQVLGCVLVFRDVTEKRRLQNQIAWQAGHDVLTGLPNRALLADRLEQAQAHAGRHRQLLGVCFLDLDNFKPVNDQHGHELGDQLLIEVAHRLTQTVRAGDTVARLGGDEFVLLITDINDMDNLEEMLGRILKVVAQPYAINGTRIALTASMGVTVYPMDDADADTLLRRADQAMYASKQAGRNLFHLFDAEQDRQAHSRRLQLDRVRQALDNDELRLYYQPKVNMRTGRIMGMEALIRWQHPEQGLLGPLEFLPLAEQTALIIDIGEWVIRRALQQMSDWSAAGLVLPVSVNVAARQLQMPDFVARLHALLQAHPQLPPQWLQLEILESAALDDIQQVRGVINACHALGVSFALDDFGTGYSSLSYLKQLPASTLKIDRSFVRDMLDDKEDLALIEGIISLAGAFQRKIIAEGVETPEQGVLLMRLGCDTAQGYGIAKPMPAQDVAGWAATYRPDPQWTLWADTRWEMTDFPLLVAQYDHLRWIKRVLLALDGAPLQLDDAELHDHRQCRFGQWYGNGGRERYGHLAEFTEIDPIHARVHAVGPELIRLRDSGRLDLARSHIPELLGLKDQILQRLSALQQAVARQSRPH